MTIKELRDMLNKEIDKGRGDCDILVVSTDCEPFLESESKFTKDIDPYFDEDDDTFTITD